MGDRAHAFEVLRAIREIARRVGDHSRFLSREAGLTVPQLMCLKAVAELDGEVTIGAVSRHVQLSAATVSRIIDRLERAGWVERARRSHDRRRVCLSLTPAGEARYQSLPDPLQAHFIARFDQLPESERRALLGALRRVVEMMDVKDLEGVDLLERDSSAA